MNNRESPLKHLIKRKPLNSKHFNKSNRNRKSINSFSPIDHNKNKKLVDSKQIQKNEGFKLNQQNISYILTKNQEGSFLSNRQDHSMEIIDKMLINVNEQLKLEDNNTENSKEPELNYSQLYQQFERLVKYNSQEEQKVCSEKDGSLEEIYNAQKLMKENSFQQCQKQKNNLGHVLKQKLQEIKQIRRLKNGLMVASQDHSNISLRLLGANVSQIHQEEQFNQNISLNRMDPIEQEFIGFVNKNNDDSKINISKIQKHHQIPKQKKLKFKNQFNYSLKQAEQDEVVAMLENQLGSRRKMIQQQSGIEDQHDSQTKHNHQDQNKQHYNQILSQLDQNDDKKGDNSHNMNAASIIFLKREEWVRSRADKNEKWKMRQLTLIQKMKQILHNPYIEWNEEDESINEI